MRKVDDQINISNKAICKIIERLGADENRGLLSQNVIDKLRTFIEAISVKATGESDYSYKLFQDKAKPYVSTRADLKFLGKFHKSLQKTVSHYLPDEDSSERLMLKYFEYLLRIKSLLKNKYDLDVLENIGIFPITIDPQLKEYYEKISFKINELESKRKKSSYKDRYYIKKKKPFFVNNEVYYEVTFTTAIDNVSKFDRVIGFTKFDILTNYAVKLVVNNGFIEVLDRIMPIQIIEKWEVSIRPCELNHFADVFGKHPNIDAGSIEYHELMSYLTNTGLNFVEVVKFTDEYYQLFKGAVTKKTKVRHFVNILDKSRDLIKNKSAGSNIIRYLLYALNNSIIKLQLSNKTCSYLSNLNLNWGCIPFDKMPFVTSPKGHNPGIRDLFECLDFENREYELFARLIKNNTESKGCLYTPIKDISNFDDINQLIHSYNNKLYDKHRPSRDLEKFKDHIFIHDYEHNTFHVIRKLKGLSDKGINNYSNSVKTWLQTASDNVDCEFKKDILKEMFENSHVALIYGAAGTGKTRLIEHASSLFHKHSKLFLANTNPAINNLSSRVHTANSTFKTIASFLHNDTADTEFDLLFIDECSTVNNSDMLKILEKSSFKLLVLVGDVFQIESIRFGNWFGIAESFIPTTSVFELTKPYRSNNENLLILWDKVRKIEDDILEHITNNNYSSNLDKSIFEYSEDDEIILCLNYDGLYGINNINKFLQGNNANQSIQWGVHNYKVGDPILFNESRRFKPLIHNNLKGKILNVKIYDYKIQFDIEIDKSINEMDVYGYSLELLGESSNGKSKIRFFVTKLKSTDRDDDSSSTLVPFQIAYAVSIHKAQGLEYNSVKVVITDEIEEMISHNIFYTAITRTKNKLKIYWTPDSEKKILTNLEKKFNNKDVYLLKAKYDL
jgi:DNA replication protein DnaC